MKDKVTDIKTKAEAKDKLYACLLCHHHWHGPKPCCPKCTSESVIEDQLHIIPETHPMYACRCNNPFFKIADHPRHGIYFKCALCGMKHQPADIGL